MAGINSLYPPIDFLEPDVSGIDETFDISEFRVSDGGADNPLLQAVFLEGQGRLLELVDPKLASGYSMDDALQMLKLALLCTKTSPTLRPTMSTVVSMLEGKIPAGCVASSMDPSASMREDTSSLSHDPLAMNISSDEPWTESSASLRSGIEEAPLSESRILSDDQT